MRPPPFLQRTALSHTEGPPWSPTASPPQPWPPLHLLQGLRVASRRGCSWTPQTLGSRPESPSQLKCLPHAVRCLGQEVTLKEESKTRVRTCTLRPWGRSILVKDVSQKSCWGRPRARSGRGATGEVVQDHRAQKLRTGHESGKSKLGRMCPRAHQCVQSLLWGALLQKAMRHSATHGTGLLAPARPVHSC